MQEYVKNDSRKSFTLEGTIRTSKQSPIVDMLHTSQNPDMRKLSFIKEGALLQAETLGGVSQFKVDYKKILNSVIKISLSSGEADKFGIIRQQIKTIQEVFEVLDEGIRAQVEKLIQQMIEYDFSEELIVSLIESAQKYVNMPLLFSPVNSILNEKYQNLFLRRLILLSDNLRECEKKLGTLSGVTSTGSDVHEGGNHALFIGKKKEVYKPRSLAVDDALTGDKGLLTLFNEFDQAKSPLETMRFNHSRNSEEFKQKKGATPERAVDVNTAQSFFYKLGKMETASAVMGVGDLHGDNIVFSEKGPVIIDAECSFVDFGVGGSMLDSSSPYSPVKLLNFNSLTAGSIGPVESVFFIRFDEGIITSVEAFQKNLLGLRTFFYDGKSAMLRNLNTQFQRLSFRQKIGQTLNKVDMIRLVVLSTGDYELKLNAYYANYDDEIVKNEVVESLVTETLESLRDGKWIFNKRNIEGKSRDLVLPFNDRLIFNIYERAFDEGRVPVFYLHLSDYIMSHITLDGIPIASVSIKSIMIENMLNEMEKKVKELSQI